MSKRLFYLLLFTLLLAAQALPVAADSQPDFDTDDGHFFSQTNGRSAGQAAEGFQVNNQGGIPFWREFNSLGGTAVLGYPISRRFQRDGLTCQATQRAVLQWDATNKSVRLANVMDFLSIAGRDDKLRESRLVPQPSAILGDPSIGTSEAAKRRLDLLDASPTLRAAYYKSPDPLAIYGLPTSEVRDVGQANAIRFQRGVLYEWKSGLSWASAGQITAGNAGDMLKEAGLLPADSVVPEAAPAPARFEASSRGGQRDSAPVEGVATWYGGAFHGRLMSNRQPFNMYDPTTAASNIHPLGTMLRVTNRRSGVSIVVRVTDRGGFYYPIVLDLSYAAFGQLASPSTGVIPVRVEVIH